MSLLLTACGHGSDPTGPGPQSDSFSGTVVIRYDYATPDSPIDTCGFRLWRIGTCEETGQPVNVSYSAMVQQHPQCRLTTSPSRLEFDCRGLCRERRFICQSCACGYSDFNCTYPVTYIGAIKNVGCPF